MKEGAGVDANRLRQLAGRFATGVTVIMTKDGAGFHGMTANAFTSVSLDPPLILVCIDRRHHSHGLVEQAGTFTVNLLAADQRWLSDRFAGRDPVTDPLSGVTLERLATGNAVLADSLGWLECEVVAAYPGGDHTIFLAQVAAAAAGEVERPLLYFTGRYAELGTEDEKTESATGKAKVG